MKSFTQLLIENSLYNNALRFATEAHKGQIRKYSNEPYINHPIRVAKTMKAHGFDHHVQAAALLHDTIEDCGVKAETIEKKFGSHVARMVVGLSDLPKDAGNREFRAAANHERLGKESHEVQSIKCADTIDNAPDFIKNEPDSPFVKEKHHLIPMLTKAHPKLHKLAKKAVGLE